MLRHPSVESIVMVDIDGEAVAACREHLQPFHEGAFDDPRVELVADDARRWLEDAGREIRLSQDPGQAGGDLLQSLRTRYESGLQAIRGRFSNAVNVERDRGGER